MIYAFLVHVIFGVGVRNGQVTGAIFLQRGDFKDDGYYDEVVMKVIAVVMAVMAGVLSVVEAMPAEAIAKVMAVRKLVVSSVGRRGSSSSSSGRWC